MHWFSRIREKGVTVYEEWREETNRGRPEVSSIGNGLFNSPIRLPHILVSWTFDQEARQGHVKPFQFVPFHDGEEVSFDMY